MNLVKTTAIALLLATPAFAGGLAAPVMEPEVIEEESAASSRAGIIVPILAILLIGLALSRDNDPASPNGPINQINQ